MTRSDWLRRGLALVTGSAMAYARATGDVAGLAGPPGMALAAPREGPALKAAYLSYYGIGDRTIRSDVLGLLDRTRRDVRRGAGMTNANCAGTARLTLRMTSAS